MKYFYKFRKQSYMTLILLPVIVLILLLSWYQASEDFRYYVCQKLVEDSRKAFCPRKMGNDNDVALEQARRIGDFTNQDSAARAFNFSLYTNRDELFSVLQSLFPVGMAQETVEKILVVSGHASKDCVFVEGITKCIYKHKTYVKNVREFGCGFRNHWVISIFYDQNGKTLKPITLRGPCF